MGGGVVCSEHSSDSLILLENKKSVYDSYGKEGLRRGGDGSAGEAICKAALFE